MLRLSHKDPDIQASSVVSPSGGAAMVVDDASDEEMQSARDPDIDPGSDAEAEGDVETDAEAEAAMTPGRPTRRLRGRAWGRVVRRWVLPVLALAAALAAGWCKWQLNSAHDAEVARIQSVQAASENTVALLSYKPETVEKDLARARDRLTGQFRDSYTALTHDVVIPGSKQKQVAAVATVPAAASISASAKHAVVLLFVNQTVSVGNDAPTNTASSVRIVLDKIGDRWLISGFDPV